MFGGQMVFIASFFMLITSGILYNFAHQNGDIIDSQIVEHEYFWALAAGAILGSTGSVLFLAGVAIIAVNIKIDKSR